LNPGSSANIVWRSSENGKYLFAKFIVSKYVLGFYFFIFLFFVQEGG
jgi:hypothetical protein